MHAGRGVDPLNPQGAELALAGAAVDVSLVSDISPLFSPASVPLFSALGSYWLANRANGAMTRRAAIQMRLIYDSYPIQGQMSVP